VPHRPVVAAGDKLALRWSGRGTHRGEYMGAPPTGRPLAYDAITLYEWRAIGCSTSG
jgi:predicted ester cyclase